MLITIKHKPAVIQDEKAFVLLLMDKTEACTDNLEVITESNVKFNKEAQLVPKTEWTTDDPNT